MNTTELLAVFRQEVFDLETPYLWSDALVYTYIDEAQKQFCRDTYGIEDSSSFTLAIAIGTSHGAYKFTRKPTGDILAIDRIKQIHAKIPNTHFTTSTQWSPVRYLPASIPVAMRIRPTEVSQRRPPMRSKFT